MTESSRPPEEGTTLEVYVDDGLAHNSADRQVIASVGSSISRACENVHSLTVRETPDSLFSFLQQREETCGGSRFRTLVDDVLWVQLYQSPRWADVASVNSHRIALIERQIKYEMHNGKADGRSNRIEILQATIDRLTS